MPESSIRVAEKELHFQLIGNLQSSSTVVVLLHEALGSIGQWKNFPVSVHEALGFPVIVPERTGHGKSSPILQPRTERYLHDYALETNTFLQNILASNQKVILIGHSDGGTIALLLAKHFPATISSVITIAAHTFVEPETLAGIGPATEAWQKGKLSGLEKYHGNKTESLFFAWADTWRSAFFRNWDIRKEIMGIRTPVLALQGENDQYGTILQLESIRQAAANNKIIEIPDCGHHPHIEKPAETLSAIHQWISDQTL